MDFLIADEHTWSLSRLTGDEQRAVQTTAFDLQTDPAAPGSQLHGRMDASASPRVTGGAE